MGFVFNREQRRPPLGPGRRGRGWGTESAREPVSGAWGSAPEPSPLSGEREFAVLLFGLPRARDGRQRPAQKPPSTQRPPPRAPGSPESRRAAGRRRGCVSAPRTLRSRCSIPVCAAGQCAGAGHPEARSTSGPGRSWQSSSASRGRPGGRHGPRWAARCAAQSRGETLRPGSGPRGARRSLLRSVSGGTELPVEPRGEEP